MGSEPSNILISIFVEDLGDYLTTLILFDIIVYDLRFRKFEVREKRFNNRCSRGRRICGVFLEYLPLSEVHDTIFSRFLVDGIRSFKIVLQLFLYSTGV